VTPAESALADLRRKCACGHTRFTHGMWVDSSCDWTCSCPGFRSSARVRLCGLWDVWAE
jgi:hypothetical protein